MFAIGMTSFKTCESACYNHDDDQAKAKCTLLFGFLHSEGQHITEVYLTFIHVYSLAKNSLSYKHIFSRELAAQNFY